MKTPRLATLMVLLSLSPACGGGGGGPTTPTAPAGPQSSTLSGNASTNGTGGCSSGGHALSTGNGTITVTVSQASAPRIKLQICHPTAVNHATECTVPPFASLAVGEAASATLKGGRSQVVTVYPEACGSAGGSASSVTYTIIVTYPGG
jgi:microcystin-dependent protein